MLLPNRHASTDSYRYGFQGQEKDDEVKGEGNSMNYKYRMHDPRVGRFFAVDPLAKTYPWNSPYAFSENSVIAFVELEGLEKEFYYDAMYGLDGRGKPKIKFGTKTAKDLANEILNNDSMIKGLQNTGIALSGVGYVASFVPHPVVIGISKAAIVAGNGLNTFGTGLEVTKKVRDEDYSGALQTTALSIAGYKIGKSLDGLEAANSIGKIDNLILQGVNMGVTTSYGLAIPPSLEELPTPTITNLELNQPNSISIPLMQVNPNTSASNDTSNSNNHQIQYGDTLSELAQQFGTSVESLSEYNNISNPDIIYAGDSLTIPNKDSND